jgi:proteasome beta subunit
VSVDVSGWGELPPAFLDPGPPSMLDFLARHAPEALPGNRPLPPVPDAASIPHGTTILAAEYADGVMLAGDRRATQGSMIARRDTEKVFPADEFSVVGIAGTLGLAEEMVRLFRLELEHYEKVEGASLSLTGKANRLNTMIQDNLGMAMQGLAVVPLFAGFDLAAGRGRIFSFDVTGDCHEERAFTGTGSGSVFARGALKKLYREGMAEREIATAAIQALYDAAEEDTATGGPDLTRRLYPVITFVTAEGYRRLPDEAVAELAGSVLEGRHARPDGPAAPAL